MRILSSLTLFLCLGCATAMTPQATPETTPTTSGIADKVAGMQKFDGYFEFYYDEKKDQVWLVIDKLDQEFLYVNSLSAGVGSNDIGLDRNQLGGSRIVYFKRIGPKVLMIEPNYAYRALSENPDEVEAVEEAFATSIHWGFKVEAEEEGKVLVDATDFFIRDAHGIVETLRRSNQGSFSLDKTRSAFFMERTKNFPLNSEFEVLLTYKGTATGWYLRSVTPDGSAVTVRQHHSFVQLPDDNYTPRMFDPRAGYFSEGYFDYATPISEPIQKRYITRHRLEKKDPSADISDPVEPIVYYLDRGTPEPVRSALLEGAKWWNQAFEAAGYRNAFRVELLPEGADPMDLRYNVINWVHRSSRGWSYGSSVTDPRTGEIIKGHVTLGSLRVRQDYLIAEALLAPYEDGNAIPPEMQELALARLRQLSAHEVGHTIGLAHSYASSTENRASVMDYPHPLFTLVNGTISTENAYDNKIGEWDKVSVAWGYQDFPDGTNETEALESIIQGGLDKGLTFLSDQDARPQGSAHPYAHLWDNGRDVSVELDRVMDIRRVAINNFGENNIRNGIPMAQLDEVLAPLYFFHRYQTEAAVKLVGGLEYRYALRGDGQFTTRMISAESQRKALRSVLSTLDAEALALPENIIRTIPPRSMGTVRNRETINIRTGITFDPLAAAETAANMTLGLLLHPQRAARLVEYNSRSSTQPGLEEVIDAVINKTIKSARKSAFGGEVQRTVDQVALSNLLALAADNNSTAQVKALTRFKIKYLDNWLGNQSPRDDKLKAHFAHLSDQIRSFLDDPSEFQIIRPLGPPDGSPIGSDEFCDYIGN